MGFFGSAAGGAEADVTARAPEFAGFDEGCVLCAVSADAPDRTALRVAGPELDWAEVLVSAAELDWAGGFVCCSAFPWGCDGELATGREATEACTFDADTGPACTPSDCRCMYHQPPPASRTLAAIAPIRMPLLELPDPPSSMLCSSSMGSSSPIAGGRNSGTYSSVKLSAAVSSALGCSARRLAFSLSTSSCVEEGTAALRARGWSHAGIFNWSSASEDLAGRGSSFADSTGEADEASGA